jgi:hypothetical protein
MAIKLPPDEEPGNGGTPGAPLYVTPKSNRFADNKVIGPVLVALAIAAVLYFATR